MIAPEQGGETRFADATRAYADLPAKAKERIADLHTVHSVQRLGARQAEVAAGHSSTLAGTLAGRTQVRHPLAPAHPVTGIRSLLLGPMVVAGVVGLHEPESSDLLARLLAHITSAAYVYRHQWRQGDLVVWDNRAVLHTASPCDSARHRRLLYRVAVHSSVRAIG